MNQSLVGRRIGSFEIGPLIGSGGMGAVYRARDTKLCRDVAVKFLRDALTADATQRARFEREARLLAALNHPNIGAIYGFEDSEPFAALILELIEGATLADQLREGAVPLDRALSIAHQVANALEAAHEKGIIHRDLKPANIKVSPDAKVKVLDFGIAKVMGGEEGWLPSLSQSATATLGTHDGVVLGTAAYMSPEQVRGQALDKRTDIWAFGCVCYEMLTGRAAFTGGTRTDTLAAILHHAVDWAALPETTPRGIRRLLERCLEKEPKQRLHDIGDARLEIDDHLRGAGVGAGAVAVRELGPVRPRRRALRRGTTAAVLVALGVTAGWWLARTPPATSPVTRLMMTLPAGQVLERERFPPVALSPDGKLLVYSAAVVGRRPNLYLRKLDDFPARVIPFTEGARSPFFSTDGRWLAFYAEGLLKKVSVAGGSPLTICEVPPIWSASWGDKDTIVFSTLLAQSGLWRVSAGGGEPVQITTPKSEGEQHGYPQILARETSVLFSVRRGNVWQLASLPMNVGDWRLLGGGRAIGEGAHYLSTGHLVYQQDGALIASPFNPATSEMGQSVSLSERVRTSRFGGTSFAFAAGTGTLVYVPANTTTTDRTLLRVDRDGRAVPLIDAHAAYQHPALSPDGKRLAVTIAADVGTDIWIVDLGRSTRIRLTLGGRSAFPVWAPDGSTVAFQSTAPGPWNLVAKLLGGTADVAPLFGLVNPAARSWPSTGQDLLPGSLPTLSGAGAQYPLSWATRTSALAFHERKPSGDRDIWVVSPGGGPMPFLITPFDERLPRFSPDGKWLAYVSDESGRDDVYVQPFPGPGAKWIVSPAGGTDPVWARDGTQLFYRHDDQLLAVTVSTTPQFATGPPRRLFNLIFDASDDAPNYDVSPDGAWFVMPRSGRGQMAEELHVVLGWAAEIRTSVQGARAPSLRGGTQKSAELRNTRQ